MRGRACPGTALALGKTTLVLLNPQATQAAVTIDVFDGSVLKAGSAELVLQPGERAARLLNQYVPELQSLVKGYIRVSSDTGVVAFQLLGDHLLQILSAIPAQ